MLPQAQGVAWKSGSWSVHWPNAQLVTLSPAVESNEAGEVNFFIFPKTLFPPCYPCHLTPRSVHLTLYRPGFLNHVVLIIRMKRTKTYQMCVFLFCFLIWLGISIFSEEEGHCAVLFVRASYDKNHFKWTLMHKKRNQSIISLWREDGLIEPPGNIGIQFKTRVYHFFYYYFLICGVPQLKYTTNLLSRCSTYLR